MAPTCKTIRRIAGGLYGALATFVAAGGALAADLPTRQVLPEPPPILIAETHPFFVRVGAAVGFIDADINATVGGFGRFIPPSSFADSGRINTVPISYVDAGYYLTPNIAVSLSGGFPPSITTEGKNGLAAQGVLYRAVIGIPVASLSYHLTNFGPVRPYGGVGIGYAFVFRNEAAAVSSPYLRNAVAFVLSGGVDYDLTAHWGVFIDAKKTFLTQRFSGTTSVAAGPLGTLVLPVTASVHTDPLILSGGVSYRF